MVQFWPIVKLLAKSLIFLPWVKFLGKCHFFGQESNFDQASNFWSRIQIITRGIIFYKKCNFSSDRKAKKGSKNFRYDTWMGSHTERWHVSRGVTRGGGWLGGGVGAGLWKFWYDTWMGIHMERLHVSSISEEYL